MLGKLCFSLTSTVAIFVNQNSFSRKWQKLNSQWLKQKRIFLGDEIKLFRAWTGMDQWAPGHQDYFFLPSLAWLNLKAQGPPTWNFLAQQEKECFSFTTATKLPIPESIMKSFGMMVSRTFECLGLEWDNSTKILRTVRGKGGEHREKTQVQIMRGKGRCILIRERKKSNI